MQNVVVEQSDGLATIRLSRGKVNALDEATVDELAERLREAAGDVSTRAVILTGAGSFFSFGFDVPGFMDYTKEAFTEFLRKFTDLYRSLYMFPKPVVAAINGHAVAGGCMLVTACDSRVMAAGKSKISLNEITFGSTVLAGSVEMLRSCVGSRNAEKILYSGELFDADQALDLGLVDELALPDDVLTVARKTAADLAVGDPAAFSSLRELTRGPIAAIMRTREPDSIREFVEIWYSDATRRKLARIEIR